MLHKQQRTPLRRHLGVIALVAFASFSVASTAAAGDWPMWRHDAGRSAATDQQLADELHLAWVRKLAPLEPAWPDQEKLDFDVCYDPIVVGDLLIVGSSRNDRLTAYRTASGEEVWSFQAEGPVRLAPAAANGRVYFASDDGFLYCLDASDGSLEWKFRGGLAERRILGNGRLISTWPARGGPVVADGTVYFAASIWPFMGIFIHALDAQTGEVRWTNDGDGSIYIQQPHDTDSFAGVAPQGPLVVAGDVLLVPGGRSTPAALDRQTGKLLYFHLAENKRVGGWDVMANDRLYFSGGQVYDVSNGAAVAALNGAIAFDDQSLYALGAIDSKLSVLDLAGANVVEEERKDRRGRTEIHRSLSIDRFGESKTDAGEVLIKAGSRLYVGAPGQVLAIDPPTEGREGTVVWEGEVEGTPARLLAADNRLFVVTREGAIHCFGAEATETRRIPVERAPLQRDVRFASLVEKALETAGTHAGHCVVWGVGSGDLIGELLAKSDLQIIVVDPDAQRVAEFRDRLVAAGFYGRRLEAVVADPTSAALPPYFASLMMAEDLSAFGGVPTVAAIKALYESLRPYGGPAFLPVSDDEFANMDEVVESAELPGAQLRHENGTAVLVRAGALPDSGNWTHEHADASNTRVSLDARVRAPLGMLWFGHPNHDDVLPRHGHGPQPQVVDGRLVIEGPDVLKAVDIYTGRELWRRDLPGIGFLFNNHGHQPGANGIGTNYVSTSDGIYVAYGREGLRLDPATGETVKRFELPGGEGDEPATWGYINVYDDYLVAGADPLVSETDDGGRPKIGRNDNFTASKRIVVLDRHSGAVLWSTKAVNYFRHNAICAGGGRLYAVDLLSDGELERLKRRGETPSTKSRIVAFDLSTGDVAWSSDNEVFGTWLSYSPDHDVVVEAGRGGRDTLLDEARGIRVYRADNGDEVWHQADSSGPVMLHGDTLLARNEAHELMTGKPVLRVDPITGEPTPWRWLRNYGCNNPQGSQHLLTFRSGAAGYFDLAGDGGTGNFGGFRSGCTNNLIVAGGIINAPDYTRTCTCAYQNQASLALVHMPEAEMWTRFPVVDGPIAKLGLNLGAPGHRRAADGTLWLDEHEQVTVSGERATLYNRYSANIASEGPSWVAASGCRGIRELVVDPELEEVQGSPARYTVRLHFCDPDNDRAGQRIFDVELQGDLVLDDFDVVGATGARDRGIVREFRGVEVRDKLVVGFTARDGAGDDPARVPLLCGLELVREP